MSWDEVVLLALTYPILGMLIYGIVRLEGTHPKPLELIPSLILLVVFLLLMFRVF